MKRFWKNAVIGILVVLCCLQMTIRTQAEISTNGLYTYWPEESDGTCRIGAYEGQGLQTLTIPSIIDGYRVTDIGLQAFYERSGLEKIVISPGVTSIGFMAFARCGDLREVTIPESVTSIDSGAFAYCFLTSVTNKSQVSVDVDGEWENQETKERYDGTIPPNTTAFRVGIYIDEAGNLYEYKVISEAQGTCEVTDYAENNTEITIPAVMNGYKVIRIGKGAFYESSRLTSVTIPEGVNKIDNNAFWHCSALLNVDIPEGVTIIGNNAFRGCSSLSSIIIPKGVTSIGAYAFQECSSLNSIIIPDSVNTIDNGVFQECRNLKRCSIPEGVTSISPYLFYQCSALSSVTIPESVTSIGNGAFRDCGSLRSISIPTAVTSIGDYVFKGCRTLSSIVNRSALSIDAEGCWYDIEGNQYQDVIPPQKTVMTEEAYLNATDSVMVKGIVSLQYKKSADGTYTIRLLSQISKALAKEYSSVGMLYEGSRKEELLGNILYSSVMAADEIIAADSGSGYVIVQLRNVPPDAVFYVMPIARDKTGSLVDLKFEKYKVDMNAIVSD